MPSFEGPKTIMPSPEELEGTREKERLQRLSALLNPDYSNSRLLFQRIREQLYDGEADEEKRRQLLKEKGYDPALIEQIGEEQNKLFGQYASRIDEIPNEREKKKFLLARGLIVSKAPGGKEEWHSRLSSGLAYEIVRQARKLTKAAMEKDPKQQRSVLEQDLVEVSSAEAEKLPDILRGKTPGGKERLASILDQIKDANKRQQYLNALRMLNLELQK